MRYVVSRSVVVCNTLHVDLLSDRRLALSHGTPYCTCNSIVSDKCSSCSVPNPNELNGE